MSRQHMKEIEMQKYLLSTALSLVAAVLVFGMGCGGDAAGGWEVTEGDGGDTTYGAEEDSIVVAGEDGYIIEGDPGDECVDIDDECYDIDDIKNEYCDDRDAQIDVIVVDGEVVDVICYPPEDGGQPIEEVERDEDDNAEVPQTDNNAVIIFGEDTDGEPIEGDIVLEAERTTLFGNGVDNTIIDGDIIARSNQSRIRGLTVTGDVTFEQIANGSQIAFCKIYGDLEIVANNVTVANCQVFGSVTVTGHDATLVDVGVQNEWNVNPSATCEGCYRFTDENEDFEVQEDEIGEELTCDEGEVGENAQNVTENGGAPSENEGAPSENVTENNTPGDGG